MLARLGLGVAGPSRLGLCARAPIRPRSPLTLPGAHFQRGSLTTASVRGLSTTPARFAAQRRPPTGLEKPLPKLTEREWPWRPVSTPTPEGVTEVERVIFARPVTTDPRLMWVFGALWLAGSVVWLTQPKTEEYDKYFEQNGLKPDTILGIPNHLLDTYVVSGIFTALTISGAAGLAYVSRLVTRLSLVRRTTPTGTTELLRLRTLGPQMTGLGRASRDLPREQCKTFLILGRPLANGDRERTSTVALYVHSPGSQKWWNKDHWSYRMEFADSPRLEKLANEGAEVVLSVRRVEDVFGRLGPKDGKVQQTPKVQQALKGKK